MNCRGQSKGALVGLLAVILIAGYFIVRQVGSGRPSARGVDWVCEECDHTFIAPLQMETRDCPRCPGEAVRSFIFYNTETGELVELYREKPHPDAGPDMPMIEDPLVKEPGGEWRELDHRIQREYGFPVRVENPEVYTRAPPGSDYRR